MNARQLAKFRISGKSVRGTPSEVAEVFALLKLVPVRCESLFAEDCLEFVAISERFQECPDGCCPPEVELVVRKNKSGGVDLVDVVPR